MQNKVDVVFCKDCRAVKKQYHTKPNGAEFCLMICPKIGLMVKEDFFCAWGKRKETEE